MNPNTIIKPAPDPSVVELSRRYLGADSLLADFGSGRGRNAIFLAEEGHTVAAIEPNEAYLAESWALVQSLGAVASHLSISEGNIRKPIFDQEVFDGVFVTRVMQELSSKLEAMQALKAMQAITLPNGHNFVTAYTATMEEQLQKPNLTLFEKGFLSTFYQSQGWNILESVSEQAPLRSEGGVLLVNSHDVIVAQKPA